MSLLNPLSNAFGLDIGDRTFKLVQVRRRGHDPRRPYQVTAWATVDVPEGVMERGEVKDAAAAATHIKKLVDSVHGRVSGRAVVACLPEARTFIKIIEVPKGSSDSEMAEAVRREIEQNIPLPPEDIYSDWQVLPERRSMPAPVVARAEEPAEQDGKDPKAATDEKAAPPAETPEPAEEEAEAEPERPELTKVLLGAAPKTLVDDYTAMIEQAGLAPIALEIEATAISRAIVPSDEFMDEAVGILDIGATRSSLVIYDSGALQMSISIPISGNDITKLVSDSLNVSMDDAEKLKRECGLDANRCEDKMWNILLPLIDDITEKIRNALRFYKIGFPSGKKIERMYLCGGGALFREIDTVLSRKLTISAMRGNALANVDAKLPKDFPRREEALTYATAIGLAIRAAEENAKHRNSLS